jgi:hypothetical protein
MNGQVETGPTPYRVPLVTEMTSDQLVAFVETRQAKRLKVQLSAHKIRKADAEMQSPAIISQRLAREHEKLQKAMESYERAEEKFTKALSNVVALRSQLGLEDHNG